MMSTNNQDFQTMKKILGTLGEDALAYRFASLMADALERDDKQAAQNGLSHFLGEMRFGGEAFSGGPGDPETIDVLIHYRRQDALVQVIDTASEIVGRDGLFRNGHIEHQKVSGLARLQEHILNAVHGYEDTVIASKVFDLSRRALVDVQTASTLGDAPYFHYALQKIGETATRLYDWSTKPIHAPDVRSADNKGAAPVTAVLNQALAL